MTVEEYRQLPGSDCSVAYELHEGELVMAPRPKWRHLSCQRRIRITLEPIAEDYGVIDTEFVFRPLPEYEVWAADVAFVYQARQGL